MCDDRVAIRIGEGKLAAEVAIRWLREDSDVVFP
jgi:hypothetical protein